MSAFLGPIHLWLFKKIKFQNKLTEEIINKVASEDEKAALIKELDSKYGVLEQGELADIIDESNIHGWLQARISVVEGRLALTVTELVNKNEENLKKICEAAYAFGKENAVENKATAREVFEYLDTLLLNGMPCDRVNNVTNEAEDEMLWEQTVDIHKSYWDRVDGNIAYYYEIRKNLINGILADSNVIFNEIGDQLFQLREQ